MMKNTLALALGTTMLAASFAQAATVTNTVTGNFSVSGQSLFGSGGSAGFNGSVGTGSSTSTFQFSASTGANSGSVNSSASASVVAEFESVQSIGTGSVNLGFGSASASFSTALGAFMDVTATVRTPEIPILLAPNIPSASIPFNLIDEDYQLNASKSDATYSLGQSLTDTDSVSLPGPGVGIGITVNANPNVDQSSTLQISELVGTIVATNQSTGTMLTSLFSSTGGIDTANFDFSEAGIWDLQLEDFGLVNSFDSTFGLSATFSGGAEIGFGCGNPATNNDNAITCLFDAGVQVTTPTVDLLPISPFSLNYNQVDLALGSIEVLAAPIDAVPLPATLPLLASVVGFGAWRGRRQRQLKAA